MRSLTYVQPLSAAAACILFAGCSGGSAVAPKPLPLGGASHFGARTHHPYVSFDACPATGQIAYVSDAKNNVTNIYAGRFNGQGPCGQIASATLNTPEELYVKADVHDLYVANLNGNNVLVFHRGQTEPYNTYTDPTIPSGKQTEDVAVAKDGTVIASNVGVGNSPHEGSLSTWIGGPNGGTFVGNFPMLTKDFQGGSVTVRQNGVVYFTDTSDNFQGRLGKVSCPLGACGSQTRVFIDLNEPGGMQFDASGDLLAVDEIRSRLSTFELPNPRPSVFPLAGGDPRGMAINKADNHLFITEEINNYAAEYSYPGGIFLGSVPNNPGGDPEGIAIDP